MALNLFILFIAERRTQIHNLVLVILILCKNIPLISKVLPSKPKYILSAKCTEVSIRQKVLQKNNPILLQVVVELLSTGEKLGKLLTFFTTFIFIVSSISFSEQLRDNIQSSCRLNNDLKLLVVLKAKTSVILILFFMDSSLQGWFHLVI